MYGLFFELSPVKGRCESGLELCVHLDTNNLARRSMYGLHCCVPLHIVLRGVGFMHVV